MFKLWTTKLNGRCPSDGNVSKSQKTFFIKFEQKKQKLETFKNFLDNFVNRQIYSKILDFITK